MPALVLSLVWALVFVVTIVIAIIVAIRHWNEPRGQSSFIEMVYILPFATFPIGANIVHLLAVFARPISVSLEVIFFTVMWVVLHKSNMKNPTWCKLKTLALFGVQIIILLVVREIVNF